MTSLQPSLENRGPSLIIGACRKFRNVIGGGISLDPHYFSKIIDGMGSIGSASTYTQYEQSATLFPNLNEYIDNFLDGRNIQFVEDFSGFGDKCFREVHCFFL